jgi:tetracycline repressor-like protein
VLRCYLVGLRAALADPAAQAALGMLMAAAGHVPAAADALREVMDSRRSELNDRLADLRPPLDEDDFSRLNGPLLAACFVGCRPISDRLIDAVVDSFTATNEHAE